MVSELKYLNFPQEPHWEESCLRIYTQENKDKTEGKAERIPQNCQILTSLKKKNLEMFIIYKMICI